MSSSLASRVTPSTSYRSRTVDIYWSSSVASSDSRLATARTEAIADR